MASEAELDKLWAKVREADRAVQDTLRDCRKQGRKTQAYINAKKDLDKATEEYEKAKNGPRFDPLDPDAAERRSNAAVLRAFLGPKDGR